MRQGWLPAMEEPWGQEAIQQTLKVNDNAMNNGLPIDDKNKIPTDYDSEKVMNIPSGIDLPIAKSSVQINVASKVEKKSPRKKVLLANQKKWVIVALVFVQSVIKTMKEIYIIRLSTQASKV